MTTYVFYFAKIFFTTKVIHSFFVDTISIITKKIYNTCKGRKKYFVKNIFEEFFYVNACHVKYSSRVINAIWYAPW
jgi:hypothetical protein